MSEGNGEDPGTGQPEHAGVEHTGNPVVDAVLESLERLEEAPVSEHVEIFETAHEKLRAALADAGNDPSS
ncbi:MAG TPA: hypothetical protein VFQ19_05375 [Nocardioidaceae bacterium]|nr:hypothetical protein [Nocardioidaceae bacterium]